MRNKTDKKNRMPFSWIYVCVILAGCVDKEDASDLGLENRTSEVFVFLLREREMELVRTLLEASKRFTHVITY